jgi:hypothetical protein
MLIKKWLRHKDADPTGSTTLVCSVIFFMCSEWIKLQEEIACLPLGEVLEDRNGDRGQDAQVGTGALPAALCNVSPYSKHGENVIRPNVLQTDTEGIRIQLDLWIRIQVQNPGPDPGKNH